MRKDLTDITLIVDRSGSMESCKLEAQKGLNAFIEDQKKQPGETLFSLVQFDNEFEYVFKGIPINNVKDYELIPRGMTALLDATGRTINEIGERLSKIDEDNRPGLVVIAIITDGEENASHEFTKARIKEMITHQQDNYNWQFTFLGANQDAFSEGHALGIKAGGIANYSSSSSASMSSSISANINRMRSATLYGLKVDNTYTDEERKEMS